jgi:hypothetical protein
MGSSWLVGFPMLALCLVALAVTITFAFPIALTLSFSPRDFVLMEGAMTLFLDVAVAVKAAAAVKRLAVHPVGLLEASAMNLVSLRT